MKKSPVMLNSFQHQLRLSLITTIFLALIPLSSCDNFLKNGQDVKNEVLDAIAYNNAPSCTISFSAEGMGEFLGNKKETFKVGYAQQVQFEVYLDDWDFTGLEAVTNDSKKNSAHQLCRI